VRVWRIAPGAHPLFDGEGTRRFGSRWIPRGLRAVHTSATLSLAALELLVHADADLLPRQLVALSVDIPDATAVRTVGLSELPADWRTYPAPDALQAIGAAWLADASSAVLRVPSAIIPTEWNAVLNPHHPDFRTFEIGSPEAFTLDPRL
jgi:RES domain-containing protein